MSAPQVVVHHDTQEMARATAARLVTAVAEAQAERGRASVVLTGGRNGNALLAAVAASAARESVDWSRVDLWWGDERFLPDGDPDRNHTQAREMLLDALPLDPAAVHPVPPSDGPFGNDPEAVAEAYARELVAAAGTPAGTGRGVGGGVVGGLAVPSFDVLLLGVGPDTHVASLFPGLSGVREKDRPVIAVRESPKPPPTRISLTLPAIRAARQVWLLAAGEDKAEAVRTALAGEDPERAPASAARGAERTLWLLDTAAASRLPAGIADRS